MEQRKVDKKRRYDRNRRRQREVVMYVRVDDRVTTKQKNVEIVGQLSAIQSKRQTNRQSDRGGDK